MRLRRWFRNWIPCCRRGWRWRLDYFLALEFIIDRDLAYLLSCGIKALEDVCAHISHGLPFLNPSRHYGECSRRSAIMLVGLKLEHESPLHRPLRRLADILDAAYYFLDELGRWTWRRRVYGGGEGVEDLERAPGVVQQLLLRPLRFIMAAPSNTCTHPTPPPLN